jgi:hypothetical protein
VRRSLQGLPTVLSLIVLSLVAQPSPGQEALADFERRVTHDNGLWVNRVWEEEPKNGSSEVFLLDRGVWRSARQDESRADLFEGRWTLGLGERNNTFGELVLSQAWQRRFGYHQLELNWGGQALAYDGSVSFQDLEAQYRLSPEIQISRPANEVRSREIGVFAEVRDSWRVTPTVTLNFNLLGRRTQFEFDTTRRDRNELWGGGTGFDQRWSRWTWTTSVQGSQVRFVDARGQEPTRRQELTEGRSFLATSLVSRLQLGLGVESLQSRFNSEDVRTVQGPAFTLGWQSDARLGWEARFGYLREKGGETPQDQSFGSFNLNYRINRQNNLTVSLSKEIDLLSSFETAPLEQLARDSEQRFTLQESVQWEYLRGRHRFRTLYVSSRQSFLVADVVNQSVRTDWAFRLSRISEVVYGLEWRHNQENLIDGIDGDRSVMRLSSAWRRSWGGGARSLGARPYITLEASLDRLEDHSLDRRFYRALWLAGLGQEWSL